MCQCDTGVISVIGLELPYARKILFKSVVQFTHSTIEMGIVVTMCIVCTGHVQLDTEERTVMNHALLSVRAMRDVTSMVRALETAYPDIKPSVKAVQKDVGHMSGGQTVNGCAPIVLMGVVNQADDVGMVNVSITRGNHHTACSMPVRLVTLEKRAMFPA